MVQSNAPSYSLDKKIFQCLNESLNKELLSEGKQENQIFTNAINQYYLKYDKDYAAYVVRYLNNLSKHVDLIDIYHKYGIGSKLDANNIQSKSGGVEKENWFEVLGIPMINYFLGKTFGKVGLKSRFRQMMPFVSKASTGNKQLDNLLYIAMSRILNNAKNLQIFFKNASIQRDLFNVAKDIYDGELFDAVNAYHEQQYGEDENTNESYILEKDREGDVSGIGRAFWNVGKRIGKGASNLLKRGIKGAYSAIRGNNNLSGGEAKGKFKVLDNIIKLIPNLNDETKQAIWRKLSEIPYEQIDDMIENVNAKKMAEIVSDVIVQNIINSSIKLYFKKPIYTNMVHILRDMFINNEDVKSSVQEAMRQYFLNAISIIRDKRAEEKKYYQKQYGRNKYKI